MNSHKSNDYYEYDDSYPTCHRTHATLCIYLPDTTEPNILTEKLGIQPTRSQKKGDIRRGKVKSWPNAWFLESQEKVDSKDVRRHIDWLLDQLEGKSEYLCTLQQTGCEMVISCLWTSEFGHGGPMIDSELMKRLTLSNLGIGFDIFFDGYETPPDMYFNRITNWLIRLFNSDKYRMVFQHKRKN